MANDPERVFKLNDLFRISDWQHDLAWRPLFDGVEIYRLYDSGSTGPRAALLRYQPGARVPAHEHMGYEHIFVLSGEQADAVGSSAAGSLTINPPGTRHSISSETGCIVLAIYEKPVKFLDKAPS
jgi:anti-sigma factor ChrR (cupin superfamily)